ncbi:MAG TPA: ATP-binding cassette domain-containing protein [Thermoanaerobaculia bacterium]|nr:ATP-binding cassette domain-containing protein [Thermoanaerobaculia bacterium]
MPTPTLELRALRKAFGKFQAVDGVSLTVPPGTVFGLLGPNGAGKTTTIRMLMDIIGPDSGEVWLFGNRRRRKDLDRVGYLPEERGLYRKMTVSEQLLFLGQLHGRGRRELEPRIEEWLGKVGLGDRARAKVEELSKGMQQKVQLVGTLLHDPELLILDEPFSGLDPINQGLFKDLLAAHKEAGRTVLFSTHVMEQAEKLCDHIALIARGRVVLEGQLAELKRRMSGNSYRLVARGDLAALAELPEVEEVLAGDGAARLLARPGVEASQLLRQLVSRVAVEEFRSAEPDLEEIFVKAVHEAMGEDAARAAAEEIPA